jgi:predicted house-cleaning NTP pyrophosphatase (Maf/HAM1 superfamily)
VAQVLVPTFDETLPKASFATGADYATATAKQKALEVSHLCRNPQHARAPDIIIAADTVMP